MTTKQQKLISVSLITMVVLGGFQALIYIVNLNQIPTFIHVAFWIWAYLFLKVGLLYDLHFKNPGSLTRAKVFHRGIVYVLERNLKVFIFAVKDRLRHLFHWQEFIKWVNYLFLPGTVYWATVAVIFINQGHVKIQQIYAFVSSIFLVVLYWYIKEVFLRKKSKADPDIFVVLSVIKIFAVALSYAALLIIFRRYCINPSLFFAGVFVLTFSFFYQALFQHKLVMAKGLFGVLGIAFLMSTLGNWVYLYWGYNYFTAAIFMTAFYNLFWGVYHHSFAGETSKKAFFEIFIICFVIAVLAFVNTNFKGSVLGACLS